MDARTEVPLPVNEPIHDYAPDSAERARLVAALRELSTAPLTIAVLDAGGHLLSLQREDGASMLRPQIAIGKAWGAVALGKSSRVLAADAQQRPSFITHRLPKPKTSISTVVFLITCSTWARVSTRGSTARRTPNSRWQKLIAS